MKIPNQSTVCSTSSAITIRYFTVLIQYPVYLFLEQFFVAFSIRSNAKQLLYSSTKNAKYSSINFIKVFTCSIIFFGHRLVHYAAYPVHNVNKLEEVNLLHLVCFIEIVINIIGA